MENTEPLVVRDFDRADAPQLWELMRQLAKFEGYIDEFAVTEADLVAFGLGEEALFHTYVASIEADRELCGMAVTYPLLWTFDRRPTLVLKELFVSENARGAGVGAALFRKVAWRARQMDASRLHWTVLRGNRRAEAFYTNHGGKRDQQWIPWVLDAHGIAQCAASDSGMPGSNGGPEQCWS